jgi:hypothetical protein
MVGMSIAPPVLLVNEDCDPSEVSPISVETQGQGQALFGRLGAVVAMPVRNGSQTLSPIGSWSENRMANDAKFRTSKKNNRRSSMTVRVSSSANSISPECHARWASGASILATNQEEL